MKYFKFKRYLFADGTVSICRGMSAHELRVEEMHHGKCLSITPTN